MATVAVVPAVSKYEGISTGWGALLSQALDELQDVEWTPFPFVAPWGNTGTPTQDASYRLVGNMVYVRGIAKRNAAANGQCGNLPADCRPLAQVIIATVMDTPGHCRVDISPGGLVTVAVGQTLPPTYASLDGIQFSVT
jgi:hypothetical protein